MEYVADNLKRLVGVAHAVSVGKEECLAVKVKGERLAMDNDTTLLFKIIICPYIMVPSEVMHFYTAVGQFGEFAQKACIAFWHRMVVFVPEVKHITEEVNGFSGRFYLIEKTDQTAFLHPTMWNGEGA